MFLMRRVARAAAGRPRAGWRAAAAGRRSVAPRPAHTSYRSRVDVDKGTEGIEPRSVFPEASVDPTEAREANVRRFGRSDRSAQHSALQSNSTCRVVVSPRVS